MIPYLFNTIPYSIINNINNTQINKLNKLGLLTIQDLLLHLPLRYEDRTQFYRINNLLPGIWAMVEGKVIYSTIIFSHHRRMFICKISDGSDYLTMRFFNFNTRITNSLVIGTNIIAYGEVKYNKYGIEIIHPHYFIKKNQKIIKLQKTLTPIYPTTEGIHQKTLRNLINYALKLLDNTLIDELLPPELSRKLISLKDALRILHHPPKKLSLRDLEFGYHPAQRRLILEELLAYNLNMLSARANTQRYHAIPIAPHHKLINQLLATLPFSPTSAQKRVIEEIKHDLSNNFPMMRLVQGDVGSGKTLVAAIAALNVITHNKQVVLMVPTELLAEQHANNFRQWFSPLGIEVGWLAGKQNIKERKAQQEAIAIGKIAMIVGTHALFQKHVKFKNIALVIIDEQHRFGVHQRLALWEKGKEGKYYPHQLIMTATPIPRTLAMITYADLDISTIDEMPPGRIPINTVAISDQRRSEIIKRMKKVVSNEKRQAYWICTLIEESEQLRAQAAEVTWKKLKLALPDLQVGLIHGRMKYLEQQSIMHSFKMNEIQLLVATTVIEVGIDVPNASLMIIENPERLGLAQLHQLRGRVGRGSLTSHCILLYKSPLSQIAQKRLQVLRNNNDGFIIAQYDLEIRGPGELLGTKQTGNTKFKVANLLRDQSILAEVHSAARYIHKYYPKQAQSLIDRWISKKKNYHNA
ncbi:ATP-dependent DNA helicase RecG [Pantoea sp. Aalb]|uniref:ATP-dependent DNA helicase RecG n=1 Tax=Pantoea sp. Aalb TaxID=2576762 RepID=UPI0013291073|nr:ATP-dependent DNA helicase RecG [Pantoea sp. Aalb]MXP67955.1 ATP-dependent DNA helicase RecG [Pantoea sp. Aalb]